MVQRGLAVVLALLILGGPIAWPYVNAFQQIELKIVWSEWSRIGILAINTLHLLVIVVGLVIPPAIALAVLFAATNIPARRWLLLLLVMSLAVPLPISAVAWQGFSLAGWSPFRSGVLAAAWIHSIAGLPWIVVIVSLSLLASDSVINDDARLSADPWRRFMQITVPRLMPALWLATLWLATTVAGEIVVTDLMQVRTFGEEVYTQLVSPAAEAGESADVALARAVMASLALVVPLVVLAAVAFLRSVWRGHLQLSASRPLYSIGRWRWVVSFLTGCIVIAIIALPILALATRTGAQPQHSWSAERMTSVMVQAGRESTAALGISFGWALFTGTTISGTTLGLCWWARTSRLIRTAMFVLATAAVIVPATIVGLGMKQVINWLMELENALGISVAQSLLYDGPSYLPVCWVWAIRSFPLAVAILWPVVRDWPLDETEVIRLETGRALPVGRHVLWPIGRDALLIAIGVTSLFCFGEVSASRLAATPGAATFAHELFTRMHYGLTADLAANCLWGLVFVNVVAFVVVGLIKRRLRED